MKKNEILWNLFFIVCNESIVVNDIKKCTKHEFAFYKNFVIQLNWFLYNCERCKKVFQSVLNLWKVNPPWGKG